MKIKQTFCFSAILLFMFWGEPAMATEEPVFTASLKEGAFEVRSYPALVAAEVSVTGTRDEASSAGFKLLAGYIFGGNTRRQSISMTAPVVQSKPGSETIAMTAPVIQSALPGEYRGLDGSIHHAGCLHLEHFANAERPQSETVGAAIGALRRGHVLWNGA